MTEQPKSGGRWGDYVALAIGYGLIAYFTHVDREAISNSKENLWQVGIVVTGVLIALGILTYLVVRLWDWLRSKRAN